MTELLDQLQAGHVLRPVDVQAARLLQRINGGESLVLGIAAAFASRVTGQGHTCLPLSALAGLLAEAGVEPVGFVDVDTLRHSLLATTVVGRPDAPRPLILAPGDRLYMLRFYRYETAIAAALHQRTCGIEPVHAKSGDLLTELFPPPVESTAAAIDWQRVAAALALLKRFVVISGGPGTGKTHTVARLLAALTTLSSGKLRIGLAAPTGKAALRLRESICQALTTLPAHLTESIPDQAQTLHRLLGFQPNKNSYRYHAGNPLHLDLLILDEASMIDVALMATVLAALPPSCRLILLGDRHQLTSVDAGNVLADICGTDGDTWSSPLCAGLKALTGDALASSDSAPPLADSIVVLRTSHRFGTDSGIGRLARAINNGNSRTVQDILQHHHPDLRYEEQQGNAFSALILPWIHRFFTPLFAAATVEQALGALEDSRILCALREGPRGVEGINALVETVFRNNGCIDSGDRLYRGMPIMIRRNEYSLALFNGDSGILWPDDQGILRAWFMDEDGGLRWVSPARLPPWQPGYAITVHKSQGSEFPRVLFLLPDAEVQVLTRELLYTAVTRAKEQLILCGDRDLLLKGIRRAVIRYSGLNNQLRRLDVGAFPPGSDAKAEAP